MTTNLIINPMFADAECEESLAGWMVTGGWSLSIKPANPAPPCRVAAKFHANTSPPGVATLEQIIPYAGQLLTFQFWWVSLSTGQATISISSRSGGGSWQTLNQQAIGGHVKTWRQSPPITLRDIAADELRLFIAASHGVLGGVKFTGFELLP